MENKRTYRGRDTWETIICEWQNSGLSGYAYCKEKNLNNSNFHRWKRILLNGNNDPCFVEIPIAADNHKFSRNFIIHCGTFKLEVPSGFSQSDLTRIMNILGGLSNASE